MKTDQTIFHISKIPRGAGDFCMLDIISVKEEGERDEHAPRSSRRRRHEEDLRSVNRPPGNAAGQGIPRNDLYDYISK